MTKSLRKLAAVLAAWLIFAATLWQIRLVTPEQTVTAENVEKVRIGMTFDQVRARVLTA